MKSLPCLLLRVDGSVLMGLGHVVRCLALAHILKNDFKITFYCNEIPETLEKEIIETGFSFSRVKNELEFLNAINSDDIVILDGYHFDTNFQIEIKKRDAKLVCIDDLHDKEFVADLIINHAPGVKPSDYKAQSYTQFALGLEYALLRPAFLEQANKPRKIERIETLMICYGGSDSKGITKKTLEIAVDFLNFKKIIVVTGSAYQITDEFKQLVFNNSRVQHRHALNEQQMVDAMLESDIAIVSASGILLETICCSNIPLICWYTENQKDFHSYMSKQIGLNSFGDNSTTFQSESLTQQLKTINLNGNKALDNLKVNISRSNNNLLNQFFTLSKQ